uniref:Uncharacterized protein n=1 Tax=Oryza brachyantha TaxID=4533 RepID=J3LHV6_ORYBR
MAQLRRRRQSQWHYAMAVLSLCLCVAVALSMSRCLRDLLPLSPNNTISHSCSRCRTTYISNAQPPSRRYYKTVPPPPTCTIYRPFSLRLFLLLLPSRTRIMDPW